MRHDAPGLPAALHFMRLLWAPEHVLQKTSKRMAAELGVTGLQRLVIRMMGLSPGVSAGALAALLHIHSSTLTGVLQRLGEQGLIRRVEHETDRRRAVLHLTAKGQRINTLRRGTVEAGVRAALRAVSARDQRRSAPGCSIAFVCASKTAVAEWCLGTLACTHDRKLGRVTTAGCAARQIDNVAAVPIGFGRGTATAFAASDRRICRTAW